MPDSMASASPWVLSKVQGCLPSKIKHHFDIRWVISLVIVTVLVAQAVAYLFYLLHCAFVPSDRQIEGSS